MGSEAFGPRGGAYRDTGCRTGVGKGEVIQSGDRNRLLVRNISVANTTIGTNPYSPFAYATELKKIPPKY